jgi:GNAT superfamily N-acetyltransferase
MHGPVARAIVAYRWDLTGPARPLHLPYLRRSVRLALGDALVYDLRTLPASRRLRLGTELVTAAVERARRRGARRCVGLIAAWNRASLPWAELLGW